MVIVVIAGGDHFDIRVFPGECIYEASFSLFVVELTSYSRDSYFAFA